MVPTRYSHEEPMPSWASHAPEGPSSATRLEAPPTVDVTPEPRSLACDPAGARHVRNPALARLMSVAEVADLLGICRRTVWRWAEAGRLPAPVTIGRVRRWRADVLMNWIENDCLSGPPSPSQVG